MSDNSLEVNLGVPNEYPVTTPEPQNLSEFSEDVLHSAASAALDEPERAVIPSCVTLMSQMQPIHAEILRGIRASRVLRNSPGAWMHGDLRRLQGRSQVTTKLDEFWSHSWRTRPGLKYASILYRSNGLAAFVLGTLSALVACALQGTGVLHWHGACMMAGAVGYYSTLLVWCPRAQVFLDVACVDQVDPIKKVQGLMSMGAFLRASKSLVVFWDVSFVTRLWCLFEVAGFMHTQRLCASKTLEVCPVFVGPALLCGHAGLTLMLLILSIAEVDTSHLHLNGGVVLVCAALMLLCLTSLAYIVLLHCRSIEVMQSPGHQFSKTFVSCFS